MLTKIVNGLEVVMTLEEEEAIRADWEANTKETPEQTIARLESAVDKYLNEQANSLRYESIKTIVSYRDDPNPRFKAEGIAGYLLRSAVYTSSINLIADVTNGLKEVPTEAELIASLPKISDFLQYE